jgi:energy-coupling factor transporter ATP-binding protein EcfA2
MMRTRLARFSAEFDDVVRPLLAPLQESMQALQETTDELPDRELVPDLRELHHQLEVLANKVAEQQAFILIFGPLKSGKSTLMNALSAAYVSEVTSLPAYPCMVYLSHSPRRSFRLTRYDGKVEELTDPAALRLFVQRGHAELAARLREVESRGEAFDPAVHLPHAIRRIDVGLPAGELAQSGAVLVDTPGLYSRMKFGYDRMTREFRNAAACAMFVVKTDNLFLEQVFEEFGELLELFSRIFLVVNVDTQKVDLDPSGELVPSLEQSDPLRLIEAFENLAMSAPLKQAAEEGRLRIYPVDLLRAASWRIRRGPRLEAEPDEPEAGEDEAFQGQESFRSFLKDLTDFLNSTDYLNAFLGDSLRRARALLGEAEAVGGREAVQALFARLAEHEGRREEERRRRDALARLATFGWADALAGARERLTGQLAQDARRQAERVTADLDHALGT